MRPVIWIAVLGIALPLTFVLVTADLRAEDEKAGDTQTPVETLIKQLGVDDFRTREQASKALAARGAGARAALEKARDHDASPEVRWRAEQLLRRLDGTSRERALGGGTGGRGGETGAPGRDGKDGKDGRSQMTPQELAEHTRKLIEKAMEGLGSGVRPNPLSRLLGRQRVAAPGLVLERSLTGRVTLRVQREDESGAKVEDVFSGPSLEDILTNHPELDEHKGMAELKRRNAEGNWPGLEEWRKQLKDLRFQPFAGGGGVTVGSSSGVEIRQDADGATVRIRERGEDGKETVKEYKGATIDEIKKAHPELKDKLGSVSIRFGPPQIFWPDIRHRPLNPLTPPVTPRARGRAVFGLTLTDVGEALASHLGLDRRTVALVENVVPGSQAEALGILRNDIIVKVGDQAVGVTEAADLLRHAGTTKAPLTLELIRRGKAMTLRR